jgi:hypothetical protein
MSSSKPKMHLVLVQDKQTTKPNNVCPMSSSKPKMHLQMKLQMKMNHVQMKVQYLVQDKQTTKPNNATALPITKPKFI